MKTGIVTFHNTLNPGAALQAYSLCRYLREQGASCEIVDYRCPNILKREQSFRGSPNAMKNLALRVLIWPRQKQKITQFLSFLREESMLGGEFYTPDTIREANRQYDAYIAGSDQIWNTQITDGDMNYFLAFAENREKFAYAASMGEPWRDGEEATIGALLGEFRAIGVREERTLSLLRERFGLNSDLVCDPTMLLEPDEWKKLAQNPGKTDYVLVYMAGEKIKKLAEVYAQNHHKTMIFLGDGGFYTKRSGLVSVSVRQWLGYILQADCVFTDSYHGLLFSLYFGKKVFTCYSGKRGERQKTILKRLGAECCRAEHIDDLNSIPNFGEREEAIRQFREQSCRWIRTNILDFITDEK